MEPGVRAAGGGSPAQREQGSAAPGGPGWRSLFLPDPDSALQSQAGTFAGSACATLKFLLERDLEEEREALLEDQKICRSRARKLCIETNRRRKALEEKQRAKEEKELRSREQILKQRKLKLQEATEKFQRAHLPFSQRRRIVQRKPAPRLEEALEQIQGSVLTSGLCLSSSNRHKSSCRTTDSPSDSSASKNGFLHRKQISTNGGYDKMIQENSGTNLDSDQLLFQQNLEEMQRLLEKQHLSSLANFHQEVNQITNSDSPSSLDSLEAGEQNENYTTPSETSLTTQWDDSIPYNSQKSQSMNKSFLHTPELTFSKNQHVNNWLINLDTQNSQPNTPFHDTLANVLIPVENVHNPKQKSFVLSGTEKRTTDICTSDNQITFVNSPCTFMQNRKEEKTNMLKVPSSGMVSRESSLATDSPVFKSSKAWVTSDSTPRERVLDSVQEQSSELTQQRRTTSSVQTSNQPMATPVILPPKQWSSTGVHNSTFSSNPLQKGKNTNTVPCTDNLDNLSETKDENIKNFNGINQGSSLFQDTSNASILCNTDQEEDKKEEKGNVAEAMSPLSNAKFNGELSEHHRYLRNNMHERKGVKLPKSILKKESKYENYCFKAVVLNRRISFGNQTASSIRDSLELAKIKGKDAENQKTNKKLRWFDETDKIVVEDDEKCTTGVSQAQLQPSYVQSKLNDANNNLRSIPACTTNSICTENHQDYPPISTKIVAAGGSERDCMPLRCFVSTGYHFAKQAWMASKGDESKPPAYSGDSKIQKGNLCKGDFRHYDARYNNSGSTNLQPIKANISHVTLDGGNLLTTFKSSRMNGFFSSSSNGAVPVTRRKQISDNSENKRRALLEQRRQIVASAGRKPTHYAQNTVHTVQRSPFQCAFEPVQTVSGIPNSDEVSESTAQFLLAENLAGTSVTEGEILAALETVQPPGQTMVLNKAQRRGMSALSLEEQKILQSLDRLNQRLQNVQETIAKNLSVSSVLQIISPLNIQQSASSSSVDPPLAMRRYRSMSADTLSRLQRRY
ncbi:centrosomal protein of 126 kDa isoform X2 [Mauremys reevesii]|uniref:centrosomal protein of 126 kDa isoform X2 n=1 Tax=Mauremys reevesii TaxID=260615 RepID=UPI00193EC9E2|nr:centrosomal protein of 126 kDa isoform X2 [Mauremys reevesii]